MRFVWDDLRVDRAHYEEIAGQLRGLLVRLDDRLPGKDVTLIAEFIDANEPGLALEQMADVLSEDQQPLTPDERVDMLALVDRMQMGDASATRIGAAENLGRFTRPGSSCGAPQLRGARSPKRTRSRDRTRLC